LDEIVDKRYKDSIKVEKPEGPKTNAQDEYDLKDTLASDA